MKQATVEQLQSALAVHVDPAHIQVFSDLQQATQAVISGSQPQDLIVVCGSFHTIGEALATLEAH